jgi:hypothetical protein
MLRLVRINNDREEKLLLCRTSGTTAPLVVTMNGVKGLLHVRRKILVATALNRTTRFFAEPVLSEGPRMTR